MSYARWSEGSVYVFGTGKGFVCMVCSLMPKGSPIPNIELSNINEDFNCKTSEEMLKHLMAHRSAGDIVPQDAIDRLTEEIKAGK